MTIRTTVLAVVVGLGATIAPAFADDCRNPVVQTTVNRCAEDGWRVADRALNDQYRVTRKALAGYDADGERLLVTAQKAWIAFRDAHCETAALSNKGGSMEPLMRFSCLARVTEARTRELKELAREFGD